jgi:hypothetical protein
MWTLGKKGGNGEGGSILIAAPVQSGVPGREKRKGRQ